MARRNSVAVVEGLVGISVADYGEGSGSDAALLRKVRSYQQSSVSRSEANLEQQE